MLLEAFESSLSLAPLSSVAQTALAAVLSLSRGAAAAIFVVKDGALQMLASNLDDGAARPLQPASAAGTHAALDGERNGLVPFVQVPIRRGDQPIGLLYVEGPGLGSSEARGRVSECAAILGRMLSDAPAQ